MARNLQEFFSNFNNKDGNWVQQLDTQNTFDCTFEVEPNAVTIEGDKAAGNGDQKSDGLWDKIKNGVSNAVGGAIGGLQEGIKNTLNSATGGLWSSLAGNYPDIEKERDKFEKKSVHTFLEYLCNANIVPVQQKPKCFGDALSDLTKAEKWTGGASKDIESPLVLNLGPYIQKITLPNLTVPTETVKTMFGQFPYTEIYVTPDNNQFMMDILNTKVPLHERIFYPWMREITLPYWSYGSQPYSTATVTIDMTKHADIMYVFYGVRPCKINTYDPSQETPSSFSRTVDFLFDWMVVRSSLTTHQDWKDKIMDSVKSLAGGVGKML